MKLLCFSILLVYQLLAVSCKTTRLPGIIYPNKPDNIRKSGALTQEENQELQATCGRYDENKVQKSINGKPAVRREAPWVVGVSKAVKVEREGILYRKSNKTSFACSGTLISPRHVLSARHCLVNPVILNTFLPYKEDPEHPMNGFHVNISGESAVLMYNPVLVQAATKLHDMRFVFDDDCAADILTPLGKPCTAEGAIVRKAVKSYSPNVFIKDFTMGSSDLVIFELDEPVPIGPDLYPACLSEELPAVKDVLDLYGFGMDGKESDSLTGSLQHISVTTLSCLELNSPDVVCVRSNTQISGKGDSGGGYVYKRNGTTYVTALVSGEERATDNYNDDAQTGVAPHLK